MARVRRRPSPELEEKAESLGRLEALSDGIFAVGMTLLIYNIKPPVVTGSDIDKLGLALVHMLPRLGIFAMSFLIVGFFWITHHTVFATILRGDRILNWLNLLFLLGVVALPFSTSVLGMYPEQSAAIDLYGANIVLCNLALLLVWFYATHEGYAHLTADSQRSSVAFRMAIFPIASIAAMVLGAYAPVASIVAFVAVPIFYIVTGPRRHAVEGT